MKGFNFLKRINSWVVYFIMIVIVFGISVSSFLMIDQLCKQEIQKINLIAGKTIKFRADNDWADNWGIGTTTNNIPFGVSSNGGDNFPIEKGGEYLLVLNDLTKHYMIIRTEKLP